MTGDDVEVVCGDWEIGKKAWSTSGEEYNVVFNIEVISDYLFMKFNLTVDRK